MGGFLEVFLALGGAELLLYPTAIGSEPHDPHLDTRLPWQRVMQCHAVANAVPVLAANRVGTEGDTLWNAPWNAPREVLRDATPALRGRCGRQDRSEAHHSPVQCWERRTNRPRVCGRKSRKPSP